MFGFPLKWIILAASLAICISGLLTAVHYYDKNQREIGAAAEEKKYADLRAKGETAVKKYETLRANYAQETGKQLAVQLLQKQTDLQRSEAKRATDYITFAETNTAFRDWGNTVVDSYAANQLRLYIEATRERTSGAVVSGNLPK